MMRAVMGSKVESKVVCSDIIYNGKSVQTSLMKYFAVGKKDLMVEEYNSLQKFYLSKGEQYARLLAVRPFDSGNGVLYLRSDDNVEIESTNDSSLELKYLKRVSGSTDAFLFCIVSDSFRIEESKMGDAFIRGQFKPVSEWK